MMDFRILGQLEVHGPNGEVRVPAGQLRVLLAGLLARANSVVSFDEIGDYLWGSGGTGSPTTIRSYVRRLRDLLTELDPDRVFIHYRSPGYRLRVEPDEVDLLRFRDLTARAKAAAQPGEVADLLGRALALWRGPALADVRSEVLHRELAPPLTEERLLATEWWIDAHLGLGDHESIIAELAHQARQFPLRETFQAQLMQVLYRSGRQAEALQRYEDTRRALADQLGVNPGQLLEQTYLAILREDDEPTPVSPAPDGGAPAEAATAVVPAPAQLPADMRAFTGRAAEVGWLRDQLTGPERGTAATVAVVAGAAGVGKTSLAVHVAHQVREEFPDGQLFVNLRGDEDVHSATPDDVLRSFLRALGAPDERIPGGTEERSALFRSLLADRRVLIVLDNAATADQVRPLLPGTAGCAAVVTSRFRLAGLTVTEHARRISLDVLSAGEAVELIGTMIDAERTRAERHAVRALAELCDRLPLALRIASARLLAYPNRPIEWLVAELGDEQRRLSALAVDGDATAAVPVAFESAYHALKPEAARMFRLLGLHPGPDFTVLTAAALADCTPAQAQVKLETLAAAHLVQEGAGRRYTMHDLVRIHAREKAMATEPEECWRAAVARMLDYYLAVTDTAGRPYQQFYPPPARVIEHEPTYRPTFSDRSAGLAWVTEEYLNLCAATRWAARLDEDGRTWQLADAIWFVQHRHSSFRDWVELHQLGLTAAQRLGDLVAQERMLRRIGIGLRGQRRFEEAAQAYRRALEVARTAGDVRAESQILNNLGFLMFSWDRRRDSLGYYEQALAIAQREGLREGQAQVLGNLAQAHVELGEAQEAETRAREALALLATLPDSDTDSVPALTNLGEALQAQGRYAEALASHQRALEISEAAEARTWQAEILECLGEVKAVLSGPEAALGDFERAYGLYESLGDPRQARVGEKRAKLVSSGAAGPAA